MVLWRFKKASPSSHAAQCKDEEKIENCILHRRESPHFWYRVPNSFIFVIRKGFPGGEQDRSVGRSAPTWREWKE